MLTEKLDPNVSNFLQVKQHNIPKKDFLFPATSLREPHILQIIPYVPYVKQGGPGWSSQFSGMDDPGIESQRRRELTHPFRTALEPTEPPVPRVRVNCQR
jgi:hypothetical protein